MGGGWGPVFLDTLRNQEFVTCETLRATNSSYKNNYGGISSLEGRDEPNDNAEPVEEQEEGCASEH